MRFCINMTALFDLMNAYTGSRTVGVTTIRHTVYMMRKGWLELLRNWIACAGRNTFHRKSNWAIIPQPVVIRIKRPKNAIRRLYSHCFGVRNPSRARTRKITTLSVKANIIP